MSLKQAHLRNIYFPVLQDSEVGIFNWTDHADLLIHKEFEKVIHDEPVAVQTSLGWVIIGKHGFKHKESIKAHVLKHCHFILETFNKLLSKQIERFWQIDCFNTKESDQENLPTPSEKPALEILGKNTSFKECHFEVSSIEKK